MKREIPAPPPLSPRTPPGNIPPPSFWGFPPKLSRRSWRRQIYRDLVYRCVSLLIRLVRFLGPKRAARLASWVGVAAFTLQRREHRVAVQNLSDCLGETTTPEDREAIVRSVFRNAALSTAESIGLSRWDKWKNWIEFEWEGLENLDRALSEGKGVICPNAHFGNWEVMTALVCSLGYPGNVIARPFKDPRLEEWITQIRKAFGIQVIHRGKTPMRMVRALQNGEIIGVMIDMDTRSSRGIFVDFFGKPAYTQTGLFALARRLGTPIVPALCYREGMNRLRFSFDKPWHVEVTENAETDIRKAVQKATKDLEEKIRRYPDQWAWFHKRWKTTPDKSGLKMRS